MITETTYAGYGNMCQDSSWNVLSRGGDKEPTRPLTTTTSYDDVFHTLPITVTNPLSHATITRYYGVNGSGATVAGAFFGQVESVTDPNGAERRYAYDAFGRLTKVIEPGDTADSPTVVYAYHDDDYEPPTPAMRVTWRKAEAEATPWFGGGHIGTGVLRRAGAADPGADALPGRGLLRAGRPGQGELDGD